MQKSREIFWGKVMVFLFVFCAQTLLFAQQWNIPEGVMLTDWGVKVDPENCHGEYPRPQMERKNWKSLNGMWDYAIRPKESVGAGEYDGKILVPFPPESALSGVKKSVNSEEKIYYCRMFEVPEEWKGSRILLNFEAVDWEAEVRVNGREVGVHRGGYVPFSMDITQELKDSGQQLLEVTVYDATSARGSYQPRGKQSLNPEGIWYTGVTGIWGSVWLEPVSPEGAVVDVWTAAAEKFNEKLIPTLNGKVYVEGTVIAPEGALINITASDMDGAEVGAFSVVLDGKSEVENDIQNLTMNVKVPLRRFSGVLVLDEARLWTPDHPYLYTLTVDVLVNSKMVDSITGYFGVRTTSVKKTEDGHMRLLLNDKFMFQYGLLDQGWWPDGLYTAPTDDALKYDVEITKAMGFNMLRKHVKVEPRRYYAWCDKLGILVWQDMVSGDFPISEEGKRNYYREWGEIVKTLRNSPSIIMWVVFNEGWGQFDTPQVVQWTQALDPTRLVNCASGWTDVPGCGSVKDVHSYPGPDIPDYQSQRAMVLGEFGGLGLPVREHLWQTGKRNWGYVNFSHVYSLTTRYSKLVERTASLIPRGLSAAVYTQTTDVETETNGLLTYDRKVNKMGKDRVKEINQMLFSAPKKYKVFLPTAEESPRVWRYTFEKPEGNAWTTLDFDATLWQEGPAGFGREGTPGADALRTKWDTRDIWMRQSFTFTEELPKGMALRIHHDDDVEVYLNGVKIFETTGYTVNYEEFRLDENAVKALKEGPNVIAVHVHQKRGLQYIDLGILFEE
ncbi:MAG: glycoside hydrolase family 2 TIM barrel-domain containing protein [Planctomycetia bacterium]|nr:glycoside hydrolase family 2 TIM barrel-domain containing protein [Planctomycetia bacterium]